MPVSFFFYYTLPTLSQTLEKSVTYGIATDIRAQFKPLDSLFSHTIFALHGALVGRSLRVDGDKTTAASDKKNFKPKFSSAPNL
ncbi:Uncharacterized protein HZ326_5059 [Fusarium oxysporum f. sp. albedinis]|nr:Uncharacterized protein HZ326_5059 [Fusarium oxysporum f. sp. albedinis]